MDGPHQVLLLTTWIQTVLCSKPTRYLRDPVGFFLHFVGCTRNEHSRCMLQTGVTKCNQTVIAKNKLEYSVAYGGSWKNRNYSSLSNLHRSRGNGKSPTPIRL